MILQAKACAYKQFLTFPPLLVPALWVPKSLPLMFEFKLTLYANFLVTNSRTLSEEDRLNSFQINFIRTNY